MVTSRREGTFLMGRCNTSLNWVADKGNDEHAALARLHLASVHLDKKSFDKALKQNKGQLNAANRMGAMRGQMMQKGGGSSKRRRPPMR